MPFCPSCGKPVDANVAFCPNCGYSMQAGGQGAAVPGGAPNVVLPMTRQRPSGVAILAFLQMLGGVLIIIVGILALAFAGLAASYFASYSYGPWIGAAAGVVGGILLIIGLIAIGIGYGLWNGKGWAWTATLIFSILGILLGLLSLPSGVVGLLIDAAIIYYLFRLEVKQYFGK
jgi:hypothetical protein